MTYVDSTTRIPRPFPIGRSGFGSRSDSGSRSGSGSDGWFSAVTGVLLQAPRSAVAWRW